MGLLGELVESFWLGAATPLTALCVVPLYPGFLAYLSGRVEAAPSVARLGGLVAAGVVAAMAALGLVFATLLETPIAAVAGVASPVAFALLAAYGTLLLAGIRPQSRLPSVEPPSASHPSLSAFAYGAFFAAVVLPCNPGFVALFFARAFLFADPVASLGNFLAFGVGMAAPLVALAAASEPWRDRVLGALTAHRRAVDVVTGAALLAVSTYYLVAVFRVVPGTA
jgi:cytochrome c-type biogenesis protein